MDAFAVTKKPISVPFKAFTDILGQKMISELTDSIRTPGSRLGCDKGPAGFQPSGDTKCLGRGRACLCNFLFPAAGTGDIPC